MSSADPSDPGTGSLVPPDDKRRQTRSDGGAGKSVRRAERGRRLENSDDGAGDPQSEGAKMFRGQWLRKHEEGMERPIGGRSARTCNARSKNVSKIL